MRVRAAKSDVVATALSLVDTPYSRGGRLPGVGIDCLGVVIVVMKQLCLGDFDKPEYRKMVAPSPGQLFVALDHASTRKSKVEASDILVLQSLARNNRATSHVGIAMHSSFVHLCSVTKKVVLQSWSDEWRDRLVGIWAMPGV